MNTEVNFFFNKAKKWQEELKELRSAILDCGLEETLKWGCPCYVQENNNIVLIHAFKDYCAVLFFKGALLKDPDNVLIQQTEHVQAARQMRFSALGEVIERIETLKIYVKEAIGVEKAGLKVAYINPAEFAVAPEFQNKLDELPDLKKAFEGLTPGRQRAYLLHFSQAKLAKTREARVEKAIPGILNGLGLDDELR